LVTEVRAHCAHLRRLLDVLATEDVEEAHPYVRSCIRQVELLDAAAAKMAALLAPSPRAR
jgi:hypothetical protein